MPEEGVTKKQRRFMFWKHPRIAERWRREGIMSKTRRKKSKKKD
jgi:ribosomal protein L32E